MLVKATISSLIFCLEDLFTEVNEDFKIPNYDCVSVILSLYIHHDLLHIFRSS